MPDNLPAKHKPHPRKRDISPRHFSFSGTWPAYSEIQVTTNFTFLTGASHPEELVDRAAALGYRGIAVTDTNSLAGAVRMHVAARQANLSLAIGCRLLLQTLPEQPTLTVLVYPTNRQSYGQLCQLLTRGKLRASKGECCLTLHDLLDFHEDLLAVMIPHNIMEVDTHWMEAAEGLKRVFTAKRLSIGISYVYGMNDRDRLDRFLQLSRHAQIPLAATNDVQYHVPSRKALHDILACIRHGVKIQEAGFLLQPNAEQYLKSPQKMHDLFAECPQAIERSLDIIEHASAFSLDELRYEYPHETCPPDKSPMQYLEELTWQGARKRYPAGVPSKIIHNIRHELNLIDELDYPHYFLTVHDIVAFARKHQINCQGRGAAANSTVCYCLWITEVNPGEHQLLFERFVSKERDEPPDIDIDFEHERREEVIQYIYGKYGRHRAALTAEVITYRSRSAIREVGKALGLSLDCVDRLAKDRQWFDPNGLDASQLRKLGMNPKDPILIRLGYLIKHILGFPRHLSQHVGGFVLTEHALSQTVPIENAAMPDRTVIEWDKDDIEALGMLKVDVLGLGMLTCIRKCFELIHLHYDRSYTIDTMPREDPAVYDMICEADTIGVFQIESRAQMSMLPRLKPRKFYDLVIEVAIVRPGPIHGKMVHPYLRRRNEEEDVEYPSKEVEEVLERTLGVPLFQEQAMKLTIVGAGFTSGEADHLRRAMAAWKRKGHLIKAFGEKIINGMLKNGYSIEFAERCFNQIKGFGEYGFPESHAASFALLVYVSAWQKCHYPAAFAAALINSQPMGFYAPSQIIRDAKAHGVEVRPVDINHSQWDCTLEPADVDGTFAIRLGMRLVKGLAHDEAERIVKTVAHMGEFDSIELLWRSSKASVKALRRLASADAYRSMQLDRQQALWQIRRLRDEPLPLFDQLLQPTESYESLPQVGLPHKVLYDYRSTGLSLKAHPLIFFRRKLNTRKVIPNIDLTDPRKCPHGKPVMVAGIVLVRQRPGTASGIVFITIEDETGIANLIVRPHIFDRYRSAANHSQFITAGGVVERDPTGKVVHVMVKRIDTLSNAQDNLQVKQRNFH